MLAYDWMSLCLWHNHILSAASVRSLSLGGWTPIKQLGLSHAHMRDVMWLGRAIHGPIPISGKLLTNFQGHWSIRISVKTRQNRGWSIRISPEIHMDQWLSNLSESSGLHRYRSVGCSSLCGIDVKKLVLRMMEDKCWKIGGPNAALIQLRNSPVELFRCRMPSVGLIPQEQKGYAQVSAGKYPLWR